MFTLHLFTRQTDTPAATGPWATAFGMFVRTRLLSEMRRWPTPMRHIFRQYAPRRSSRRGTLSGTIEIFDDFFSTETQHEILQLMERPKWSFTGGAPPNMFWHMDGLESEPYFRDQLFQLICKKLDRVFDIERIYANGQTSLQYGHPHRDDGDMTFLYYPNPQWECTWGGSLLFIRKGEIARSLPYRPNRALLFPANLVHYADAPSKSFPGLRVSLAYKLRVPHDAT